MKLNEQTFANHAALVDSLTLQISDHLKSAIEHYGQASFIVSGGNTPKPLYQELCHQHLAWDHVTICPSDERWVEEDHPDSNFRMINDTLIQHAAQDAKLLALKSEGAFSDAPDLLTPTINQMHKPFNVVLLGMGEDGHIASLFPDANELNHGLNAPHSEPVVSMNSESKGPRISLSLSALLNTEHIYLLITGEEKHKVFEAAKAEFEQPSLPVSHLLARATSPITVCWSPAE